MKVKINNIDEFCEALKDGYAIKDSTCDIISNDNVIKFNNWAGFSESTLKIDSCYYEKNDPLKIECGKYYKTRDGKKALVLTKDNHEKLPFDGVVFTQDFTGFDVVSWNKTGEGWLEGISQRDDLVSEWEED